MFRGRLYPLTHISLLIPNTIRILCPMILRRDSVLFAHMLHLQTGQLWWGLCSFLSLAYAVFVFIARFHPLTLITLFLISIQQDHISRAGIHIYFDRTNLSTTNKPTLDRKAYSSSNVLFQRNNQGFSVILFISKFYPPCSFPQVLQSVSIIFVSIIFITTRKLLLTAFFCEFEMVEK